jgi:hypothetical protein
MDFSSSIDILNLTAIITSVCLVGGYHLILMWIYKRSPRRLVFGLNSSARRVFIASIMAKKNAILAGTYTFFAHIWCGVI